MNVAEGHDQRAEHLMDLGRHRDALKELQSALAIEPENAMYLARSAWCLSWIGEHDPAIERADDAIRIDPSVALIHYIRGYVLAQGGATDEALLAVTESLRQDSSNPDAFALEGSILLSNRDLPRALESMARALALQPDHRWTLELRTEALCAAGRMGEAEANARQSLSTSPQSSFTHQQNGWLRLGRGDVEGARRHFSEALRLDANNPTARSGLTETLRCQFAPYRWMREWTEFLSNRFPKWSWRERFQPLLIFVSVALAVTCHREWDNMAISTQGIAIGFAIVLFGDRVLFFALREIATVALVVAPHRRLALSQEERDGVIQRVAVLVATLLFVVTTGPTHDQFLVAVTTALFPLAFVFALQLRASRLTTPVRMGVGVGLVCWCIALSIDASPPSHDDHSSTPWLFSTLAAWLATTVVGAAYGASWGLRRFSR